MYRFLLPGRRCREDSTDPRWLLPLIPIVLGTWGFGVLLLLFPLLATCLLLALPFVAGFLDFSVRYYRHRRARPVHRAADQYRDLMPLRFLDETAGDRQKGAHVLVVTRRQTHIYDN
jgi:hypothetical protein